MMEDAQSMESLRHSCLRDRVIAGIARKNNVQQELEDAGRKRGRRCGTASNAVGECFSPAVRNAHTVESGVCSFRKERKPHHSAWLKTPSTTKLMEKNE